MALSASVDGTLRLWEVATGKRLRTFSGHTGAVLGCAFSPDGRMALSATDGGTLQLWEVASGASLRTFSGHTISGHIITVWSCALSPDGRFALSASIDQTLRLWDVASGEERAQWRTDCALTCCAWSAAGAHVLAGDTNGGVHILDVVGSGY
jgi:WD40 repeat protein